MVEFQGGQDDTHCSRRKVRPYLASDSPMPCRHKCDKVAGYTALYASCFLGKCAPTQGRHALERSAGLVREEQGELVESPRCAGHRRELVWYGLQLVDLKWWSLKMGSAAARCPAVKIATESRDASRLPCFVFTSPSRSFSLVR